MARGCLHHARLTAISFVLTVQLGNTAVATHRTGRHACFVNQARSRDLQAQRPATAVLPASIPALPRLHVPRANLVDTVSTKRQVVMNVQPERQIWMQMQQQPVILVNLVHTHHPVVYRALDAHKILPTWMKTQALSAKHVRRDLHRVTTAVQ